MIEFLKALAMVAVALFVVSVLAAGAVAFTKPEPKPGYYQEPQQTPLTLATVDGYRIQRVIDPELGVVCYMLSVQGGISCLYLPLRHPSHPDRQPQRDQP